MGSCQPSPAHRDPPMRLSLSAIPLAVLTTPKSTDVGKVDSMVYCPTTKGAHAHASLPKVSPENQLQASRERRYVIPRPQQDPALSDPGRRSGYVPRPGPPQHKPSAKRVKTSPPKPKAAATTGLLANARAPLYYDIRGKHK